MNLCEIERLAAEKMKAAPHLNIMIILIRDTYQLFDWAVPPIGPAYVSAALKQEGFHVFPLNLNAEKGEVEEIIRREILQNKIDVVAIGDLVVRFRQVKKVFDFIKSIAPDIISVAGGSLVTYSAREVMEGMPSVDIGIIDEGEITFCELMRCLEHSGDLRAIDGLVYHNEAGLCFTAPRKPVANLDLLPFPDWDGFKFFDVEYFDSTTAGHKIISAPLVTSRSCPFNCTYCSKSGGRKYRQRSLDNIFQELDILVKEKNVNRIFLDDELFAINENRILKFCERIGSYGIEWLVYLRVGAHITDHLLQIMKQSGCIRIFYGFESGDDSVLKSMKKKITTAMILETAERTYAAGIPFTGQFIFGDVAETNETVENTFTFAHKLKEKVMFMEYAMIRLYPGSALFDKAVTEGRIQDTLKFIENGCPLINMSTLTDEEYENLAQRRINEEKNLLLLDLVKRQQIEDFAVGTDGKSYAVGVTCSRCGTFTKYTVYPQNLAKQSRYLCPSCGEAQDFVSLQAYALSIDQQLVTLLTAHKTAFWGCGVFLMLFYSVSPALQKYDWIQVDSKLDMQGKIKNNRMVRSPSAIEEENCDLVIVSAVDAFSEIEKLVRKQYPHVSQILNLREIGFFRAEKNKR